MEGFLFAVLVGVGILIGVAWEGIDWRGDCRQLGAHLSEGKVYECKLVEKK